jgi:hypothetical protein
MRLRRNHQMTKPAYDPRYPIHGVKVLHDESESSRNFRKDIARIDREYRQTGSFFALKPGEKGKHGVVGE